GPAERLRPGRLGAGLGRRPELSTGIRPDGLAGLFVLLVLLQARGRLKDPDRVAQSPANRIRRGLPQGAVVLGGGPTKGTGTGSESSRCLSPFPAHRRAR